MVALSQALAWAIKGDETASANVSRCNLYEMAEKYDWNADDVLAFLRCQKTPSKKMLREMARELDDTVSNLEHVLWRYEKEPRHGW